MITTAEAERLREGVTRMLDGKPNAHVREVALELDENARVARAAGYDPAPIEALADAYRAVLADRLRWDAPDG